MNHQTERTVWQASLSILAGLVGVVGAFVGLTFGSTGFCMIVWLITVMFVALRRKSEFQQSTPSSATRLSVEDSNRSIAAIGLNWPLRSIVKVFLFALLSGVIVAIWRISLDTGATSGRLLVGVDAIAHVAWVSSLVLWVALPLTGHILMLAQMAIAVFMSVAAGGVSSTIRGQTAVAVVTVIGFVIAANTIISADTRTAEDSKEKPAGSSGQLQRSTGHSLRRGFLGGGKPYALATLLLMLMVTSAVAGWTNAGLPAIRDRAFKGLRQSLQSNPSRLLGPGGRYVTGDRLGGMRALLLSDPQSIALYAISDQPPGYLRGTVYDSYAIGQWQTRRLWQLPSSIQRTIRIEPDGPATMPIRQPSDVNRNRFEIATRLAEQGSLNSGLSDSQFADGDPTQSATSSPGSDLLAGVVEIYGDPTKGNAIFLPAGTRWLEASASWVGLDSHGIPRGGIRNEMAYVAGVPIDPGPRKLSRVDRLLMTGLDEDTAKVVRQVSDLACGDVRGSQQKAEAIAEFFQRRVPYSLNRTPVPPDVDPLQHFLTTLHPAHCEFFATATALMLRAQGVPTRYVTGYVMDETSEDDNYYLARNADAHAWVEFYDAQSERWYSAESTPGRHYRTIGQLQTNRLVNSDDQNLSTSSGDGDVGWWSTSVGWFKSLRTTDAVVVAFQYAQIPMALFIAVVLYLRLRGPNTDSKETARMIERRRMDRRARRRGLVRQNSETLHHFADRIERTAGRPGIDQQTGVDTATVMANWYREHANQGYAVR